MKNTLPIAIACASVLATTGTAAAATLDFSAGQQYVTYNGELHRCEGDAYWQWYGFDPVTWLVDCESAGLASGSIDELMVLIEGAGAPGYENASVVAPLSYGNNISGPSVGVCQPTNGTWSCTGPQEDPAPVATEAHVADLDGAAVASGKRRWFATVTITVKDENQNAVADAVVSGSWGSRTSGETMCVTDSAGQCDVQSDKIKYANTLYAVTDIAHDDLAYAPSSNTDPDGDGSTGTTISVFRP